MIYGQQNRPYQTNAANRRGRRPINAPINRLSQPQRFQGGGAAGSRALMDLQETYGEDVIEQSWEKTTAMVDRSQEQKKAYELAEKKLKAAQKKAKRNPWSKLASFALNFIPGVGPLLSAAVTGLDTHNQLNKAQSAVEKGLKESKGGITEEYYSDAREDIVDAQENAGLTAFITSLALSEMSSQIGGVGEGAAELPAGGSMDVAGNVLDASGEIVGQVADFGADVVAGTATELGTKGVAAGTTMDTILEWGEDLGLGAVNPQLHLMTKHLNKLMPGVGNFIGNSPALSQLMVQGLHEMGQPVDPRLQVSSDISQKPWQRYMPSSRGGNILQT